MIKSSIPIIKHIPHFLAHYKKKGYSVHTQRNYKRYLNKFTLWLKKNRKQDIKPHGLSPEDIWAYKVYLSRFPGKKGKPLKKISQNYYLIALRALLSYFVARDIVSLPPGKITLPKHTKSQEPVKFLNLDQIERLLLSPDTKTKIGLRDRVILEILISTGLKINQLTNLNKYQLNDISKETLLWIKKYLKTREDKNRALFINYRAKKDSIRGRLTARSIERIIKRYGRNIGLPFLITPETLRWARVHALLDKKVEIQIPQAHKTFLVKNYEQTKNNGKETTEFLSSVWHIVEDIINKEIFWLKNNIPVLPEKYKTNPLFLKCDDCILRKIAILIVSGKVKATEFRAEKGKDLWNNLTEKQNLIKISYHGQEWHKKMIDAIS